MVGRVSSWVTTLPIDILMKWVKSFNQSFALLLISSMTGQGPSRSLISPLTCKRCKGIDTPLAFCLHKSKGLKLCTVPPIFNMMSFHSRYRYALGAYVPYICTCEIISLTSISRHHYLSMGLHKGPRVLFYFSCSGLLLWALRPSIFKRNIGISSMLKYSSSWTPLHQL